MGLNPRCPPEGGRYMNQTQEITLLLRGGLFRPSMFECAWLYEVVRPAGKIRKFSSMIRRKIVRLNIDVEDDKTAGMKILRSCKSISRMATVRAASLFQPAVRVNYES
jgi:hypothetical protein